MGLISKTTKTRCGLKEPDQWTPPIISLKKIPPKNIFNTTALGQGIPYASNAGTGFGFQMNALVPAVSSMAWYLFAINKFNPFKPLPLNAVTIKNISDNQPANKINWTANIPANWIRADQYVQLDAQPVSVNVWGVRIYTDNKNNL